jgi:DNA-binding transcriptional ArsR family regulator
VNHALHAQITGTSCKPVSREIERAAELFDALSNDKRLLALLHLIAGELSVGALAEAVGISQSALSQHLARLRKLNLVKTRRRNQTIFYWCDHPEVQGALALMRLKAHENAA